jgi:hypothetical protein
MGKYVKLARVDGKPGERTIVPSASRHRKLFARACRELGIDVNERHQWSTASGVASQITAKMTALHQSKEC